MILRPRRSEGNYGAGTSPRCLASLDTKGLSLRELLRVRSRVHTRAVLREKEFLGLQFFDRVAQFRCFFEFEALGGFAHVAFQFGDVGVHFFLGLEFGHALGFGGGEVGVIGGNDARPGSCPADARSIPG